MFKQLRKLNEQAKKNENMFDELFETTKKLQDLVEKRKKSKPKDQKLNESGSMMERFRNAIAEVKGLLKDVKQQNLKNIGNSTPTTNKYLPQLI